MPPSRRAYLLRLLLFILLVLLACDAISFRASLPRFFQVIIEGLNHFDYLPAP